MRTLLFTFLLLGCKIAFAQSREELQLKRVIIKNSSNKSYDLGSPKILLQAFGKPQKIVKEKDEMLDGYFYTYQYKGLEVIFDKQGWDATTIKGDNYTLLLDDIAYKVGENISKFKKNFPRCFFTKKQRGTSNTAVQIWIGKSDTHISVDCNDQDIITIIEIGMDNS